MDIILKRDANFFSVKFIQSDQIYFAFTGQIIRYDFRIRQSVILNQSVLIIPVSDN